MNKKKNHQLIMNIKTDKSLIPEGKASERIVEVNLIAPPAPDDRPHLPLNLAIVLDRSGSMHGEKLQYVKEAAQHVVDLMTEEDRVSLVVYDNSVDILMSSQFLTPQVKRELKAKIKQIQSGGSTFLYGGWVTGSRQVAETLTDTSFNRTLLLTDGLANVGERRMDVLSMHAQELFMRNISTSCFGVGQDYDEHLLEAMSNLGGGNFHFLETVQAIPLVFEREFDEIISMVVKDVKITLTLPKKVDVEVSASWHSKQEGDRLEVFLGSLAADQKQPVYLRIKKLKGKPGDCIEIPVTVTGKDIDQREQTVKATLAFQVVDEAQASTQKTDDGLMERFAEVDLADKANEALKRERAGDRVGSSQLLQNAVRYHQSNISMDTSAKYAEMSQQMAMGMDEIDRKRRHYDAYQNKRSWQPIRDYRMHFNQGVLVAKIDDLDVLVETNSPVTIGKISKWRFMDQGYKLLMEHKGVTCDKVSDKLGTHVDVVLGMDILKDVYLRLDPGRGVISFSRQAMSSRGWRLDLDEQNGGLSCTLKTGGEDMRMRVMTATRMSYIPEALTVGLTPLGLHEGVIANLPAFETESYNLPVSLGRHNFQLSCGALPEHFHQMLGLDPEEGILGASFFEALPSTLAFPEGQLVVLI